MAATGTRATERSSRHSATSGFEDETAALCALAETQPQSFIDNLDWEISQDFSLLQAVDPAEAPAFAFQSEAWLRAWLDTIGATANGLEIALVCARIGGRPLIVVPLCTERRGPFRRAHFIAQSVSDYNEPLFHRELAPHVTPALMGALWGRVSHLLAGADYLVLGNLPARPADPATGEPWRRCAEECERSHWLEVEGAWETAEARFFGAGTLHSLSRKQKKLAKLGPLSWRLIEAAEERRLAMATLIRWKAIQLSPLGAVNPFARPAFVAFLERLAAAGAPRDHRIYAMFAGERMLAVTYMICGARRWFLYQTAITDDDPRRYSPGLSLLRHILMEAHATGIEVFDFGLGNEAYKQRFCDRETRLYRADMPITAKGRIAVLASDGYARLRDAARTNPALRRPTLAVLQAVAAMRQRKA